MSCIMAWTTKTRPELISGEGDDKKTEHMRMLTPVYPKISHVKKTVIRRLWIKRLHFAKIWNKTLLKIHTV